MQETNGLRTFKSKIAAARTLAFLRKVVDETKMSFEAARVANVLFYQMHFGNQRGDFISEDRMISSDMVVNGVVKLGEQDNADVAARRRASPQFWGVMADGGRGFNLAALSLWDRSLDKAVTSPLACADLMHNGSAANSAATLNAAIKGAGLAPKMCCNGLSDGAPGAQNEIDLVLDEQHRLGGVAGARSSDSPTCSIHGWALEEKHGLVYISPGERVVDAMRLLWEVVAAPENNQKQDLRLWWVEYAKFMGVLFDQTLGMTPEFSTSKWGIIFEGFFRLAVLLETPDGNPYALSKMGSAFSRLRST